MAAHLILKLQQDGIGAAKMSIAPRFLRLAFLAAAMGAAWVAPFEARASVAICEQSHSGEIAEDKSELLAKKRALESWVAYASRYGNEFTRWGIAWNRQLDAHRRPDVSLQGCRSTLHHSSRTPGGYHSPETGRIQLAWHQVSAVQHLC